MRDFIQNNDVLLFENAFTYATIGKALVALDGLFLKINRSFCRMVGYSEEELLNRTFQDITHPDDLSMDLDYIRQLTHDDIESYQMEKRYFHKLGHVVWVLLSVSLVRDEHRKPLFFIAQVQDISERKRVERELKSERDKFESIINGTADAITIVNFDGRVLQVNPAYERLFGWHPEEVITKLPPAIPEPYRAEFFDVLERVNSGENVVGWETVRQRKDGTLVDVSLTVSPILDETGVISMIAAIARDITEIKQSERKARLATQVYQSITDGVIVTDEKANIVSINSAFTDITGYGEVEVLGKKPSMLSCGQFNKSLYEEMWKTIESTGKWKGEFINKRKNGQSFFEEISINEVKDGNGNVINYVGVVEDITERKTRENETRYQAFHDPLTGLANRRLFEERLTEAIVLAHSKKCMVAVLFLDLDYFKLINDSLGHYQGDQVLCMVAERVTRCIGENDTASRLGGDEFNVLLPHVTGPDDATKVAEKILQALAIPFSLNGSKYFINASIGISMFPNDGKDTETLVRNADTAMYLAKKQRAHFQFFTSATNKEYSERLKLHNDLRHAIEAEELFLNFQPKVDATDGHICGVEALARWRHPTLGMVSPEVFIPIAEETGLIIPIGEWVLRTACKQNRMWQGMGLPPIRISVNLSFRQMHQPNFAQMIRQVLCETQMEPQFLELELTESVVMQDSEYTIGLLRELKETGIQISLDDFGTGYSSLNYLNQLPLNAIKIDRTFIRSLGTSVAEREIIKVVIDLAHILNLKVIVEGVETKEQLRIVQEYKADEIQGFLFCPPVAGEEMERLLRDNIRFS